MKKNKYLIEVESIPPYPAAMWKNILSCFLTLLEEHRNFSFENCTLTLLVVRDSDMIYCNGEQMSAYGPTNVLSFPEDDGFSVFAGTARNSIKKKRTQLGTLVLSVDTLLREAFLYGQTPQNHAVRLLAHGLAHLLGYDHGGEMWELTDFLEKEILTYQLKDTITPIWSFYHG